MWSFRNWYRRRILARNIIDEAAWQEAWSRLQPLLQGLTPDEHSRLRQQVTLLLHEKHIESVQTAEPTLALAYCIALQACLPILNLDIDWYDGWREILLYPAGFIPPHRQWQDEAGVVHRDNRALSGEAWLRGPVILSIPEVIEGGKLDGHNLVIHEFAHKLDMQNGVANGMPPLHREMHINAWSEAFTQAYSHFTHHIRHHGHSPIDHYAAESPAEFFAVISEVFFELPHQLFHLYPSVYHQLQAFYRQDPRRRIVTKNVNRH